MGMIQDRMSTRLNPKTQIQDWSVKLEPTQELTAGEVSRGWAVLHSSSLVIITRNLRQEGTGTDECTLVMT